MNIFGASETIMLETKRLRIEWEGPISVEGVKEKIGNDDFGLYQIYARHVVFGAGALVYIGKAQEQTFAARFRQHWEDWLRLQSDVSVHLGRLNVGDFPSNDDWQEWRLLLCDAEKLTVVWHAPPYNSHFINDYNGRNLHIQNFGNRGSLLPEYTSHWPPLRPDDNAAE